MTVREAYDEWWAAYGYEFASGDRKPAESYERFDNVARPQLQRLMDAAEKKGQHVGLVVSERVHFPNSRRARRDLVGLRTGDAKGPIASIAVVDNDVDAAAAGLFAARFS